MTAPKRICLLPDDGWSWVEGPKPPYEENAIEYVRADLAAVQPAQVHPDPRDEVIARLVEAASLVSDWDEWAFQVGGVCPDRLVNCMGRLRAALAAAKAVMK